MFFFIALFLEYRNIFFLRKNKLNSWISTPTRRYICSHWLDWVTRCPSCREKHWSKTTEQTADSLIFLGRKRVITRRFAGTCGTDCDKCLRNYDRVTDSVCSSIQKCSYNREKGHSVRIIQTLFSHLHAVCLLFCFVFIVVEICLLLPFCSLLLFFSARQYIVDNFVLDPSGPERHYSPGGINLECLLTRQIRR